MFGNEAVALLGLLPWVCSSAHLQSCSWHGTIYKAGLYDAQVYSLARCTGAAAIHNISLRRCLQNTAF